MLQAIHVYFSFVSELGNKSFMVHLQTYQVIIWIHKYENYVWVAYKLISRDIFRGILPQCLSNVFELCATDFGVYFAMWDCKLWHRVKIYVLLLLLQLISI